MCSKIGLIFSDRMVDGWQGTFVNVNGGYNPNMTDATTAWTREAATSVGIMAAARQALAIEKMPPALQDHLTQVAIPIYKQMVSSR